MYLSYFHYIFFCWRRSRLIPYLGYCEYTSTKHGHEVTLWLVDLRVLWAHIWEWYSWVIWQFCFYVVEDLYTDFYQQSTKVPLSLHPHQHCWPVFLMTVTLTRVKWNLTVLICISLIANDTKFSNIDQCFWDLSTQVSIAHLLTGWFGVGLIYLQFFMHPRY